MFSNIWLSVFVAMLRFPGADTGGTGGGGGGGGGGGEGCSPPFVQNTFFLHAVLRLPPTLPPTPLVESAEDGQPFPCSLNIGLFLILLIGLPLFFGYLKLRVFFVNEPFLLAWSPLLN